MALAILCLTVHLDSSANVDYQSRTQLASDGRRWLLDGDPGPRAAVFLLRLLLQEFRCLKSTLGPRLEPFFWALIPFLPASWIFVLKNSKVSGICQANDELQMTKVSVLQSVFSTVVKPSQLRSPSTPERVCVEKGHGGR